MTTDLEITIPDMGAVKGKRVQKLHVQPTGSNFGLNRLRVMGGAMSPQSREDRYPASIDEVARALIRGGASVQESFQNVVRAECKDNGQIGSLLNALQVALNERDATPRDVLRQLNFVNSELQRNRYRGVVELFRETKIVSRTPEDAIFGGVDREQGVKRKAERIVDNLLTPDGINVINTMLKKIEDRINARGNNTTIRDVKMAQLLALIDSAAAAYYSTAPLRQRNEEMVQQAGESFSDLSNSIDEVMQNRRNAKRSSDRNSGSERFLGWIQDLTPAIRTGTEVMSDQMADSADRGVIDNQASQLSQKIYRALDSARQYAVVLGEQPYRSNLFNDTVRHQRWMIKMDFAMQQAKFALAAANEFQNTMNIVNLSSSTPEQRSARLYKLNRLLNQSQAEMFFGTPDPLFLQSETPRR